MTVLSFVRNSMRAHLSTQSSWSPCRPLAVFGVFFVVLSGNVGCAERRKSDGSPAQSASAMQSDARSDGKLLMQSLAVWQHRWENYAALPACSDTLAAEEERQACLDAIAATSRLKELVGKRDASQDALRAAADLAKSAEAAERSLRKSSTQHLQMAASSATSPAGAVTNKHPIQAARGTVPATSGPRTSVLDNPYTKGARAYGRAARDALQYLGVFLEKGPLETRAAAIGEVERLAATRENWRGLQSLVRQASVGERDAALKERLQKLTELTGPGGAPSRKPETEKAKIGGTRAAN